MSTIIKRAIAVFAALMLAGMTVGCDRESIDTEGMAGDEAVGVQDGVLGEVDPFEDEPGGLAEDPIAAGSDELDEVREEVREGMNQESEALAETREDVAETLEIPTSAVVFAPEVRQDITAAPDDFEREALGTVSTVESYLSDLDTSAFNEEQRTAYSELQSDVPKLKQDLEQFSSTQGDQREQMKSQVESNLGQVMENWKLVAVLIDFEQPATGGGPLGDQPSMDQQQPSNQPSMDQQQPSNQPSMDQNTGDQMDNPMDIQPMDEPQPGQQPMDQPSGETQTY